MKRALITGITGQDGSYLAELLLDKGYEVHGLIRRASTFNTHRIEHIYADPHLRNVRLFLHYGDITDMGCLLSIVRQYAPDEVYHLAAQSHVKVSFEMPSYTGDVTGMGTLKLLEALRLSGLSKVRFYQASSSEMFGATEPPQSEASLFHPRSPYAAAKVYSYWVARNYREAYGMFACNGILFNHESPRRGETFVTRKITRAVAHIAAGRQKVLYLGNMDAKRDWGYAPEYVECQWMMLQKDRPQDFVVGTGTSNTVRRFAELAFEHAGMQIEWRGSGVEEKGLLKSADARLPLKPGDTLIEIDPRYFRPSEVDYLLADPGKALKELGWKPRVSFEELVAIMTEADMKAVGLYTGGKTEELMKSKGFGWIKKLGAISE